MALPRIRSIVFQSSVYCSFYCTVLWSTSWHLWKKGLIKHLCMTLSISNRNTFPAEKCLPRILLLRAPTSQGVPRQYTVQTVMSYIISPFSSDTEASQCNFFFQMKILSKHFSCLTLCTTSHETEPIACHIQQCYLLRQHRMFQDSWPCLYRPHFFSISF